MGVDPQATPPSLRLRGSRKGAGGSDVAADPQQRQHDPRQSNRRLEDANVDYWRSRAGWADDDESMKSYNQGVYNTYYMGDDADGYDSTVGAGGGAGGSSAGADAGSRALDHMGWILGLAATVLFLVALAKCCTAAPSTSSRKRTSSVKSRDSSRSIRDKHGERRSRSRSRAASGRSRSKSRARSKSRRKERDGEYRLMDGEEEEADSKSRRSTKSASSKKSSRSRSRSKARSRSRSKPRSKSRSSRKSRSGAEGGSGGGSEEDKGDKKKESSKEQKMLV